MTIAALIIASAAAAVTTGHWAWLLRTRRRSRHTIPPAPNLTTATPAGLAEARRLASLTDEELIAEAVDAERRQPR